MIYKKGAKSFTIFHYGQYNRLILVYFKDYRVDINTTIKTATSMANLTKLD